MADTKIQDMTAAAGGLAADDEFPIADASSLATNANVTAAVIATYIKTDSLGFLLANQAGLMQP